VIYFSPTIHALKAHIADLTARLAASEEQNARLLDRLLLRNNVSPIQEPEVAAPIAKPTALQYIAPPGVQPVEIQDAMRDVWIQDEATYLMDTLGYEEGRAWNQAQESYQQPHGIIN